MKITKLSQESDLFAISECTEDNLVAFYNIALNYRSYLQELLKKPDNVLLALAPAKDGKTVRANLRKQVETANDYINIWQELINKGDADRPQA